MVCERLGELRTSDAGESFGGSLRSSCATEIRARV